MHDLDPRSMDAQTNPAYREWLYGPEEEEQMYEGAECFDGPETPSEPLRVHVDMVFWSVIVPETFLPEENQWEPQHTECGKVVSIVWPNVVYTPIYHPDHGKKFYVTTVDKVMEGYRLCEQEAEAFGLEAEAELRAEMSIPQHLVW